MFLRSIVLRFTGVMAVVMLGVAMAQPLQAQIIKHSIWVASFSHDSTSKKFDRYVSDARSAVLRSLLASGRFQVVDRELTKELETERKLQKSESFIDGKVVEQGRAIGAEYIASGKMNTRSGLLEIVITDVATNTKVEGGNCTLKEGFFSNPNGLPTGYINHTVQKAMSEIMSRWLAKDRYTVVRELEGNEKGVEKMLLAAGSARGLQKGNVLQIFYTTVEVIDSIEIERDVIIGEMKVDLVENANFSIIKEKDGKKEIRAALNDRRKLYCRLKSKQ